jgi:hypothetical protein
VFLKSTNPSDFSLTIGAPNISGLLAKLPYVRTVSIASYSVNAFPAGKKGEPTFPPAMLNGSVTFEGSLKNEYVSVDKLTVVAGRMFNPKKADEMVAEADAAKAMHWHLGETIPMDVHTDKQTQEPSFKGIKPAVKISVRLVGLVVPNSKVLVDETDREPYLIFMTPALTRQVVNNGDHYNEYALQLKGGVSEISKVQREIVAELPAGTTYTFRVNSIVAAEVNRSIEPESIALSVFGLIAGLAALIIAAGLISRTMRRESGDLEVLRALGGNSAMIASAGLLSLLGTIILSAILSVAVAVALSPFSPIGPVRPVFPHRGIAYDWPALGVGFASVLVFLTLIAVLVARRRQRRMTGRSRVIAAPVSSRLGRVAAAMGLPAPAVVGVRFALEPGRDRDAAPVRSALVGAVLAVAIVVTTLTFGSSLSTLVTHPPLFGWNWNYAVFGNGDGVPPQAAQLLNKDPYVASWSGDNTANAEIDGVTVPILLTGYRAPVTAPLLSGHEVDGPGQVVLGAATMQQLHKHLGQTVVVSYGAPKDAPVYVPPTTLKIVGTATLPTLGGVLSLHADLGVGAIIPLLIEPPAFRMFLRNKDETLNGFTMDLVRLRPGAPPMAADGPDP